MLLATHTPQCQPGPSRSQETQKEKLKATSAHSGMYIFASCEWANRKAEHAEKAATSSAVRESQNWRARRHCRNHQRARDRGDEAHPERREVLWATQRASEQPIEVVMQRRECIPPEHRDQIRKAPADPAEGMRFVRPQSRRVGGQQATETGQDRKSDDAPKLLAARGVAFDRPLAGALARRRLFEQAGHCAAECAPLG